MQYRKALTTQISGARRAATAVLWATFVLAACDTLPSEPKDTVQPPSEPRDGASRSVATVEVTPGGAVLAAGTTVQLRALARDADGQLVHGNRVTWTSSDREIADVLDSGLVMARAVGETSISATIAGKRGSARISVTPRAKEPPEDDDKIRLPN